MRGSIYLVAAITLTLLLGLARTQHHAASADTDVYRFPPILVNILRFGVLLVPFIGLLIYRSFGRSLEIYEVAFLFFIFGAMTLIVAAQLYTVTRYSLEVSTGKLVVNDWRGRRYIAVSDVRMIFIAYPWRGRGHLDLFDESGRKLERIDGGVQDFEALSAQISNQCEPGTLVREKYPGAKWTEHRL